MLTRALCLAAALLLVACPNSADNGRGSAPQATTFVPIYFYEGSALIPEYRPLQDDEPVEGIVSLLLDGPAEGDRTNALPPDTDLLSEFEVHERLVLGLGDSFWRGSEDSIRRRAAQLVFSLATLEAGKEVTLLHGPTPGDIPDADGRPLQQPLERADFDDLRPWIQVVQPVAGALVANPMPVDVEARGRGVVTVQVVAQGKVVGVGKLGLVEWTTAAATGTVRITSRAHKVVVPVRFGL